MDDGSLAVLKEGLEDEGGGDLIDHFAVLLAGAAGLIQDLMGFPAGEPLVPEVNGDAGEFTQFGGEGLGFGGLGALVPGEVDGVERLIKSGKQVMLYFSNVAFRERDVDRKQILQLKKFKKSIQKKALIEEYDERHEFKEKLTHQLDVQVYRWFCSTESPMLEVTLRTDSAFRLYEKIIKEDLALSVCWACQVLRV